MKTSFLLRLGFVMALGLCLEIQQGCSHSFAPETVKAGNDWYAGDYKIGIEDALEIVVWKSPDLSKAVTVRPDGKITLPLIGDMTAVGLTADQLAKEITTKLKGYKESPTVSVTVSSVNSYSVYVLGEVGKPGRIQLKAYSTILQAISLSGGFSQYAQKNKIFVLRKLPGEQTETRINLHYDDIISGQDSAQNVILIPGDTVIVP